MELPSSEAINDWKRRSELGEVCGIYGCEQKPNLNCPRCGNYYCDEHVIIHFHERKTSVGW